MYILVMVHAVCLKVEVVWVCMYETCVGAWVSV